MRVGVGVGVRVRVTVGVTVRVGRGAEHAAPQQKGYFGIAWYW